MRIVWPLTKPSLIQLPLMRLIVSRLSARSLLSAKVSVGVPTIMRRISIWVVPSFSPSVSARMILVAVTSSI